jgi:hypothetical protein
MQSYRIRNFLLINFQKRLKTNCIPVKNQGLNESASRIGVLYCVKRFPITFSRQHIGYSDFCNIWLFHEMNESQLFTVKH